MSAALLSLGDIARLAKVKRPVVTMWRKRDMARGQHHPFPAPALTSPAERFDADDVIDWLRRTGRGNNPDAAIEVALLRIGPAAVRDRATLLQALVTLRSLHGQPIGDLDDEALVDLADELDPDDAALFSEISRAGADLHPAALEADELCEAAYGPAPAMDRMRRRAPLELTAPGVDLVRSLTWEITRQLPVRSSTTGHQHPAGRRLLAGLESSTQLAAELLASVPEDEAVTVLAPDPSARWLRRHLLTRAIESTASDEAPVVRLLALDDIPPSELLDRVDEVQLELRPGDVALVIAPSATLVDRLPTNALETQRDGLLRLGALRHLVRLPAGLNTRAPRQSLALWVLAPRPRTVTPAERTILVSDLSGRVLETASTDLLIGDIVADLVTPGDAARSHAFANARLVSLPTLIAGRGALVPTGTRPQRLTDLTPTASRAEQVLRTRGVLAQLAESRPSRFGTTSVGAVAPQPNSRRTPGELVTVEDLIHEGNLVVIRGSRLDLDRLADGPVPVITAEDVLTQAGRPAHAATGVDPLDLTRHHPRARRAEAGDIAFVTSPRPAAVVCREPGSVVAYPARTLRVQNSELVPEAVAAIINALPETDRRWHGWSFPRADHTAYDALTDLLRAIEDERADLATRHTQLDELAHLLTGGAARGTLALTTTPTTEGDH